MRVLKHTSFLAIAFATVFGYTNLLAEIATTTVVKKIKAPEARQGVAVDKDCVYAISSKQIGKYDRRTGKLVASWKASRKDKIIHLDSGVIVNGKLYAAHSNYPSIPMESSIEIWDAQTLQHIGGIPLGEGYGSCTWIDHHAGAWWVCYAHYEGYGGYFDKGPERTTLVKYDDNFNELGRWTFPKEVIERFTPFSCSGGSWGPDGRLYVSGHSHSELYVLQIPFRGSVLKLFRTIKIEGRGQGIAWDRAQEDTICTINRKEKEIVISKVNLPEEIARVR